MRIGILMGLCLAVACGGTASSGGGNTGASSDGGIPDGGAAGVAGAGGVADAGIDGGVASSAVSIELSQTDVHIFAGLMTELAVTATYPDGSRGDVTQQAQATSSKASVATVAHGAGAQIQITGVVPGTANITVTLGSLQRICTVTITPQ